MLIISIILFLLLSALFSGTEIAFISASKLRVELKRQKGSRQGTILAQFYEKPAEFLGTMLVGNNIALVAFTILMGKLIDINLFGAGQIEVGGVVEEIAFSTKMLQLLITTIITTIIVLIFGEFLPKTLFRLYADRILYGLAYPLKFLQFILAIPSWMMTKASNFILRVFFKTPITESESIITRLDLENFIKDTKAASSEEEIDTNLFEKALHLKNVKVKECMVPRTEIENIDRSASVDELKQLFIETNLSRLIVSKEDIDDILGYVHHQQILNNPSSIKDLILDIPIVPEAMRVRDLMNYFIKNRISIACVVDEYGGTAGIITMEDIVEEIFGEIEDEHDQEEHVEVQKSPNEYIFAGRLEIDYLNEKYESLQFPEGEYHTLSGYLVTTTETIPEQGAEIELNGYRFILELVSDTKIETIRVIKLESDNEEEPD